MFTARGAGMQTNKSNFLACVEHFAETLEPTMADESGVERRHGSLCGSVDLAGVKAVRRALIPARLKLWANQA